MYFHREPSLWTEIVAHSETGHHHEAVGATLFGVRDPMICYLRLELPSAEIRHLRPYDTHETHELGSGVGAIWQVRHQRECVPGATGDKSAGPSWRPVTD